MLLVIIPTYNEKENIEELVRLILDLKNNPHVLVVDDNSPDGTGKIADRISMTHPDRVHVIHRSGKLGLGSACLHGFKYALNHGYDLIMTMDADFSHHPKYIPEMVRRAQDFPIVIGSRYVPGGGIRNWGILRLINSRSANILARAMLRLKAHDCTSGFRIFRKEVLLALDMDSIYSSGYAYQSEILYRCQLRGYHASEVPIIFENRRRGASKISRKEIFRAALLLFKFWIKPLKIKK
ncbi:MAG: polyprenol monophosphomannose synthase [Candidatus Aminicenantes bacterium]|nr:polyprenol monophosphomannose synthase [Candidatus Aminicenantes bacterium]